MTDGDFYEADERRQRLKKRMFAIGAVAIAWLIVGGGMYTYWAKYGTNSEDRFDRELDADPALLVALDPLRKFYPYEYQRLRRASAENYNVDRHGRVIDHMPEDFIRRFRQRHAYEAVMAGTDAKVAYIAAQAELSDAAQKDPKLCHMLVGNEDQMSDMSLVFAQKPFARMFGAFVTVASEGLRHPVNDTSSSASDLADFTRALRAIDPNPVPVKPGDEMGKCRAAALNDKAMRALPPEQQARLASRLFQYWR